MPVGNRGISFAHAAQKQNVTVRVPFFFLFKTAVMSYAIVDFGSNIAKFSLRGPEHIPCSQVFRSCVHIAFYAVSMIYN